MHIILLFMNCYSSTININELMIGIKSTDCLAVFFPILCPITLKQYLN